YRGAGPAIADILAGQIPMIVPAMTNIVLELHRAGKLRVLAVTHGTRLTAAADLPTAVEQGLTDLVAPNFVGVFAPTGTPKPIIDQVAQTNVALLADRDYRELLVSGTFEPHGDINPEAYRRYVDNELARWSPIVKTLGFKIDCARWSSVGSLGKGGAAARRRGAAGGSAGDKAHTLVWPASTQTGNGVALCKSYRWGIRR